MEYKLKESILKLSKSQNWEIAKKEWNFEYAYNSLDAKTCMCGKFPIKNICLIRNTITNELAEVGNLCIDKFLGIEDGRSIFVAIKKITHDINKSISKKALEYYKDKLEMTEKEYNFYNQILRKRKLSYKQLNWKRSLNRRFISLTKCEENAHLSEILNYMKP